MDFQFYVVELSIGQSTKHKSWRGCYIRFWLYKSEIQLVRFGWVYVASKNEPVFIWISHETVRYALANIELNS